MCFHNLKLSSQLSILPAMLIHFTLYVFDWRVPTCIDVCMFTIFPPKVVASKLIASFVKQKLIYVPWKVLDVPDDLVSSAFNL